MPFFVSTIMPNQVALNSKTQTMSSTEIAQLTGKRKNDIHQDIKTQIFLGLYDLKDGGNLHHEQIQGITIILDNRGYWKEVLLDQEHTLTLMTGYDVKARHKINKRWVELEAGTVGVASKEPLKLQAVAKEYKGALALAKLVGYKDNQAHLAANKAVLKATGYNVHAEMNLQLEAPAQSRLINPSDIGLMINLSGIKVNQLLKDKGFQIDRRDSKNRIVWTPTEKGLKFSTLMDTGKKHSDGTPVQQIKWLESVIKELGDI